MTDEMYIRKCEMYMKNGNVMGQKSVTGYKLAAFKIKYLQMCANNELLAFFNVFVRVV